MTFVSILQEILHGIQLTSTTAVRLGGQWKTESLEVKNYYKAKAERVKRQHLKDHPDYQYQPRKSIEKRRRMVRPKVPVRSQAMDPQGSDCDAFLGLTTAGEPTSCLTAQDQSDAFPDNELSQHDYMDTFPHSYTDNPQVLAYYNDGTVPEFRDDPTTGMTTYNPSEFPYDPELLAAMIDNFNRGKPQSPPGPPIHHVRSIKQVSDGHLSSELPNSVEGESTPQTSSQSPTTYTTTTCQNQRVNNSEPADSVDFETFFDYDMLEFNRMQSLELEASQFQDAFLDNDLFLTH